jgi:basic membrane lipoprotein Med (substrate-binding protein (PBP1-ABC) superfamily)
MTLPRIPLRRLFVAAAALLVAIAATVWLAWPTDPAPRARAYLDYTACLLTDDHGVAGAAGAPVWAGMQKASADTRAKVQYASVAGPQTADNAVPFLTGLAQSRCDLVLAVGDGPVGAVGRVAARFPRTRFVVVGAKVAGGNVSTVAAGTAAETTVAVQRIVATAVH